MTAILLVAMETGMSNTYFTLCPILYAIAKKLMFTHFQRAKQSYLPGVWYHYCRINNLVTSVFDLTRCQSLSLPINRVV